MCYCGGCLLLNPVWVIPTKANVLLMLGINAHILSRGRSRIP
jgi:hypothetical protein